MKTPMCPELLESKLAQIEQWRDDAKKQREQYRELEVRANTGTFVDFGVVRRYEQLKIIAADQVAAFEDVLRLFGR